MSPQDVFGTMLSYPLEIPQGLKLEDLRVEMNSWESPCLLWPILLIKASPFLRKFSVQILPVASGEFDDIIEFNEGELTRLRTLKSAATIEQRHKCLKLVEFHRFRGEPRELELIQHLLSISDDSLEQFVVFPSRGVHGAIARPRMRANTLSRLLPPHSRANIIVR